MRKIIAFILVITISCISVNGKAQGYEIKVKMPQIKNQQLILGHYFAKGDMLIPDDTTMLNSKGVGVFTGKEKLPQGMYFIFLPNKYKFDVLITDNQKFTIENDTSNLFKNLKILGDKENEIFIDYQQHRIKNLDKRKELTELHKKTTDAKKKKELEKKFKQNYDEITKKNRRRN